MVIQWYLMASFLTRVGGNKNPATNSVLCQLFKVSHTTWGYSLKIRWCHTSGRFLLLDYPFFAANNSRKRLLVKNLSSKACNNPYQNMPVVALGNAVKVPVSIGHRPKSHRLKVSVTQNSTLGFYHMSYGQYSWLITIHRG